jgi:cysteinyl-tRNA synthetase
MATLLKFYRPFSPIRFPNSVRTIRLTTHHSHILFFKPKPKKSSLIRCTRLSSLSSPQPSVPSSSSSTELWLYNTMSKKKQVFKPKVEGLVGMYVCGVTAYDLSHIGHARVYVTFDVLYRSSLPSLFLSIYLCICM